MRRRDPLSARLLPPLPCYPLPCRCPGPESASGPCNHCARTRTSALGPSLPGSFETLRATKRMEQIKRANKLFTNDCIFLKKTLNIPVISEKPLLFNGLNSIDSPENETVDSGFPHEEELVATGETLSPPSPQESDIQPVQPEEVTARDFLQRLDLQIKLSTQAAKKLKEESRDEDSPYATSLYHS
uniref:LysM and peptidoglycan-binding domain-containing protein 2 n=1 Tax=Sus scrofa TaxID=9823 RepID=A0A8D1TFP8_PIG